MDVDPLGGEYLCVVLKGRGEKAQRGGGGEILSRRFRGKFRDALHKAFARKSVQAVEPRGLGRIGRQRQRLLDDQHRRAGAFQDDLLQVGGIQLLLRRKGVIRVVADLCFCFIQQQVAQGLAGVVHSVFAVGVAVIELIQDVVRHLRALFAALAAFAVIIIAVFIQRGDEGVDKFGDIRLLLRHKPFVIVEAVAAVHIHRRHIGDGFTRVVGAFDTEHRHGVSETGRIGGLALVQVFKRLPAVVAQPAFGFRFRLAIGDIHLFQVFSIAVIPRGESRRGKYGEDHHYCHHARQKPGRKMCFHLEVLLFLILI